MLSRMMAALGVLARRIDRAGHRRSDRRLRPDTHDRLEGRQLLTGWVGGTVPVGAIASQVTYSGEIDRVSFQIEPGTLVSRRNLPVMLSLEPVPTPGSDLDPLVRRVDAMRGTPPASTFRRRTAVSFARAVVPVDDPANYEAVVVGQSNTSGPYVLSIAVPGDTNRDGVVDQIDLSLVGWAYASSQRSDRYRREADMNGDGIIGGLDLWVTQRNLGVRNSMVDITRPS